LLGGGPEIEHLRYRKSLTEERTRAANRLHKVLQDAGIKLSSVATDMLGASGRSMLMALVAGTTDPALLADLACGQLRKKLPELRQGPDRSLWASPSLYGKPPAGRHRLCRGSRRGTQPVHRGAADPFRSGG
jgi:hypothetical protein